MWLRMLFCILLVQDAAQEPASQVPASQEGPTETEVKPEPNYLQGPMRVEPVWIGEQRIGVFNSDTPGPRAMTRIQLRLAGERLGEVRRVGRIVFSEVLDDMGNSLIDPERVKPDDETWTARQRTSAETMKSTGLLMVTDLKNAARQSRTLKIATGSLRVVFAAKPESLYLDDPRSLAGGKLEDPRLEAAGIEIECLASDEPPRLSQSGRHVALRVLSGRDRIHEITFCDPWLKPVRTSERPMQTSAGDECLVYMASEDLTAEHTIVIEFYTAIEDVRLPIDLSGLALP